MEKLNQVNRNNCSTKLTKTKATLVAMLTASSLNAAEFSSQNAVDSEASFGNNYCIAIRGNGELEPAHWGALAKTVETFGIPSGMAGGSSGSISTFLMESLMLNKSYSNENDPTKKRQILAFLIKSLKGFVEAKVSDPKVQSLFSTLDFFSNIKSRDKFLKEIIDFIKENEDLNKITSSFFSFGSKINDLKSLLVKLKDSKIFYGPQVERFHRALIEYLKDETHLNKDKFTQLNLEYKKLKAALEVFGSFNAKDDGDLFFRGGIVNFGALANAIGFVADFYSQKQSNTDIDSQFGHFINECQNQKSGKWFEQNSPCTHSLTVLINKYIEFRKSKNSDEVINSIRINEKVGAVLPALISTSVAIGESAQKLKDLKNNYDTNKNGVSRDLNLNPNEIQFGYWGQEQHLQSIQTFFKKNPDHELTSIDKSKRFLSLGQSTWITALSLSPAEPGLSSMIEFNLNNSKVVSLGGWSDLHPVPVLKAMTDICRNVVYITRSGGDAVFGQGIAKKVFNFDFPIWEDLDGLSKDPKNLTQFYNNNGRTEKDIGDDFNGLWSNMFNLANPKSSFTVSLKNSDAVVCTHWNDFNIKSGFSQMINDAYNSNIILNNSKMSILDHKNSIINTNDEINQNWKKEKTSLPDPNSHLTYPKYSGCYAYDDFE